MQTIKFHHSSCKANDIMSIQVLDAALAQGVTHWDTSSLYGDSEVRLYPNLSAYCLCFHIGSDRKMASSHRKMMY